MLNTGSLATRINIVPTTIAGCRKHEKKIDIQEIFRNQTLKTKKCVGSPLDVHCKICPEAKPVENLKF